MPRVTEAHRRARRDEIAEAAIRVLRRKGVSSTSIAQIVEESGLSAGAIYANFQNKSELALYIAQSLLDWRVDALNDGTAPGEVRTPVDVMRHLLSIMVADAPPLPLVLQFWGEATMDPDLHAVLVMRIGQLRAAFEQAIRPWAAGQGSADPEDLVRRTAITMTVLCQGFLANSGLVGWTTPEEYLSTASAMFGD